MNNRELNIKLISEEFAKIEIQIRNLNSQNLYDINIVSENLVCNILNMVFEYNLRNINESSVNFPGIDLVDDKNRIAVQVSSDKSKGKIQKTINVFSENRLYEKYDRLIFFVLGEKQKKYSKLEMPSDVNFSVDEGIVDFKDLLRFIGFLPIEKIERIYQYLLSELSGKKSQDQKKITRTRFKQILSLKKRLERDLIKKISEKEWIKYSDLLYYDHSRKFLYDRLLIRSIDDRSFPDVSYNEVDMPSWIRWEIWDFYENGLEFVTMFPKKIVIREDETWYFAEDNEPNAQNSSLFYRIPYENIVEYTMETDGYYGYPSIFVEYANNGVPYEEAVFGLMGYYNHPTEPIKSRKTYYLDPAKERKGE
jgi:hypothetical protein